MLRKEPEVTRSCFDYFRVHGPFTSWSLNLALVHRLCANISQCVHFCGENIERCWGIALCRPKHRDLLSVLKTTRKAVRAFTTWSEVNSHLLWIKSEILEYSEYFLLFRKVPENRLQVYFSILIIQTSISECHADWLLFDARANH